MTFFLHHPVLSITSVIYCPHGLCEDKFIKQQAESEITMQYGNWWNALAFPWPVV
jgi:hypothetical protein